MRCGTPPPVAFTAQILKEVTAMKGIFSYGADDLRDVIDPKPVGEPVNPHVKEAVAEPQPNFDEMQRFIEDPEYRKARER
jgi:hypothetical protein